MNIDTNTIISNLFPKTGIRELTGYTEEFRGKSMDIILNKEYPLFILDFNRFAYYNTTFKRYEYNYLSRDPLDVPLTYKITAIKSLNSKFYTAFKDSSTLKPYDTSLNRVYIGKGVITDVDFNPLVLTTYFLDQDTLDEATFRHNSNKYYNDSILNQSKMKIYINRSIYSEVFKEDNKRLHKELMNVILPELMKLDIPITFKRELDMFNTPYTDPSIKSDDLQIKYQLEGLDVINSMLTRIQ